MLTLITLVLFGILAALFATQNTDTASVMFGTYALKGVPMYLVVLGSVLVGLVLSSLISFVNSIAASLTIHGKDVKIKETKSTVVDLTKRIHLLELENERLKAKQEDIAAVTDDKSL